MTDEHTTTNELTTTDGHATTDEHRTDERATADGGTDGQTADGGTDERETTTAEVTLTEGWQGRFYEDFAVGEVYKHPYGRTVTETDNVWF
ncbi:MAG: hypothetical protein ABEI75_02035, partial [Halobaculum sp.]